MAYKILMPQLGLTMEEGSVSKWLKREGDEVKAGEVILEITTDKLVNEVTSEHDGVLLKIAAEEGADVPVKGLLGYIGDRGELIEGASPAASEARAQAPAAAPAAAKAAPTGGARKRISPLAKKTAAKLGVDYSGVAGSGAGGRITQKDILLAEQKKASAPAPVPAAASSVAMMEGDSIAPQAGMRKVVAQRMLQSHTEIPPVTQTTRVDVTELMKLRKALLEQGGQKFSVNDLVLAAVAKTLRQHPEMLVSYDGGRIIQRAHVNIGMAVALDAGLIVPVIRDADKKSLGEIAAEARELALKAKENRLTPDEYKGSTFSVSNLGMFGIESFTPIINQPDAAILGVCAIADELSMDENGGITKRQAMRLSLTYDHRLVDGAVAARFVADIRDMLQAPVKILL